MSIPIRPPGGTGAPASTSLDPTTPLGSSQSASAASQAQSTEAAARAEAQAQAGAVQSPASSVLSRLEAGEVTREQAVDALVSQALEQVGGGQLPPTQRAELTAVLRNALLEDPSLSKLLG